MTREFWDELVGTKVCGGYLLRDLIGSTEHSAVYLSAFGQGRAALKLVQTEAPLPDIPELEHPHLLPLLARGAGEVEGTPFHYFVTEVADENLGSVIAARPLTADEAKEMLTPVLDALTYLHSRGLVHGALKPSNVFAKDDSIKLSGDAVRTGDTDAAHEDMRALGLTVIEVLTQNRDTAAVETLPQPFRDIAEHALHSDGSQRWSARQAALRLSGKMPAAPPTPAPPRPAAVPEPVEPVAKPVAPVSVSAPAPTSPLHSPAPGPVKVDLPAPEPARPRIAVAPPVRPHVPHDEPKRAVPIWAYAAGAAVLIFGLIFILARGTGSSSGSSMAASAPPAAVNTPAPVPAPATKSPTGSAAPAARSNVPAVSERPVQQKPTPFEAPPKTAPPAPVKTAPKTTAKATGKGWFVVVASYTREADAEQMARVLGRRFPQFKPSVFPPSAIDSHYLVIIGSGLSQESADSLRQRAVSTGMPADTYIKRFPGPK